MNVSKQFEFIDLHVGATFVTILDEFEHHYSGTKMYHVRLEYVGSFRSVPMVKYETWTEEEMTLHLHQREVKE